MDHCVIPIKLGCKNRYIEGIPSTVESVRSSFEDASSNFGNARFMVAMPAGCSKSRRRRSCLRLRSIMIMSAKWCLLPGMDRSERFWGLDRKTSYVSPAKYCESPQSTVHCLTQISHGMPLQGLPHNPRSKIWRVRHGSLAHRLNLALTGLECRMSPANGVLDTRYRSPSLPCRII